MKIEKAIITKYEYHPTEKPIGIMVGFSITFDSGRLCYIETLVLAHQANGEEEVIDLAVTQAIKKLRLREPEIRQLPDVIGREIDIGRLIRDGRPNDDTRRDPGRNISKAI